MKKGGQAESNLKLKESTPSLSGVKGNSAIFPQSPSSSSKGHLGRKLSMSKRNLLEDIPKPNWKSLTTGLEMLFSEESVKKMWGFDKPKIIILDLLQDFFKRLDIHKNFESMELNIIAEFHLYNLIFGKQKLFLDDFKSAIFLNLMWTLLISDNADYKSLYTNYVKACSSSIEEINKRHNNSLALVAKLEKPLQQIQIQCQQQPTAGLTPVNTKTQLNLPDHQKTISRDLENFSKWILKHSFNDPPQSLKVFDSKQVQMIVEYAQDGYFANHALYNYCLNNKNKNEEIKIQLFIDKPLIIPPLSDALYMGQSKIEIPEDEEDIEAARASGQISLKEAQSGDFGDDSQEFEKEDKGEAVDSSGIPRSSGRLDQQSQRNNKSEEQEIRSIVESKLKEVEHGFNQTIQNRQEEINRQFEEIVNPKKKK